MDKSVAFDTFRALLNALGVKNPLVLSILSMINTKGFFDLSLHFYILSQYSKNFFKNLLTNIFISL